MLISTPIVGQEFPRLEHLAIQEEELATWALILESLVVVGGFFVVSNMSQQGGSSLRPS